MCLWQTSKRNENDVIYNQWRAVDNERYGEICWCQLPAIKHSTTRAKTWRMSTPPSIETRTFTAWKPWVMDLSLMQPSLLKIESFDKKLIYWRLRMSLWATPSRVDWQKFKLQNARRSQREVIRGHAKTIDELQRVIDSRLTKIGRRPESSCKNM